MQTHVLLLEAELGCDFHQLQQETMFHRTSQVAASVKVINERAFVMHRSAFEGCHAEVSALQFLNGLTTCCCCFANMLHFLGTCV